MSKAAGQNEKALLNTSRASNNNTSSMGGGHHYDQNKSNLIRFKVNKVNLIQKLDPDDGLITRLISVKVLTYEEAAGIMNARDREDRARNLIATLLNKFDSNVSTTSLSSSSAANTSGRSMTLKKDWYYFFRKTLAELGYAELVTFLDNTVISKPKFVEKFSSMSVAQQRG